MKKIYIIHENDEWVEPLRKSFIKIGAPFSEWHIEKKKFDFSKKSPDGIFYNRMSASAHSRGHRYAPEKTKEVLEWLEKDNKRIINNSRALELEINKLKQYQELKKFKIKFPKTFSANNKKELIEKSRNFNKPFITKHNRGGRGLGVKYFENTLNLQKYVYGKDFEDSIDNITLLQEYIFSEKKMITRVEFVKGKFLYAVQVDTSFIIINFCPANFDGNKFMIMKDYYNPEIEKYEKLLAANNIEIAGIEYIVDKSGMHYTYDINTNTNYNSIAEKKSKIKGMDSIASFLNNELKLN